METKLENLIIESVDASTKYLNGDSSDESFNELIDEILLMCSKKVKFKPIGKHKKKRSYWIK